MTVAPARARREIVQVAGVGTPEPIDRLRIVADDGEAAPVGSERAHDLDLKRVHVLVLVDEDMVEHRGHVRPEPVVGERRPPQEEQVVEVDLAASPACERRKP